MKGCRTCRDGLSVMWGVRSSEKECRAPDFVWQSLKIGLQVYRVSRHLQDHERDHGVCGSEVVVVVEVTA